MVADLTLDAPLVSRDVLGEVTGCCARLRRRLGADRVSVWILNESNATVSPAAADARAGYEHVEMARRWMRTPLEEIPVLRRVIEEQRPIVVDAAVTDTDVPREVVSDFASTSFRLEPLVADRPVGVLSIEPSMPELPDDVDDLLRLLAVSVGQSVARRDADRRREEAELLLDLTEAEASSDSLAKTLGEICERLARHARMHRACLYLLQGDELRPAMARYADGHADPEGWDRFRSVPRSPAFVEQVLAEGVPRVVEDADSPLVDAWWTDTFGIRSTLAVPVGSMPAVTGVLTLDDPDPRTFPPELVRVVTAAGAQVESVIARAKADEERTWRLRTLAAVRQLLQDGSKATTVTDAGSVLAQVAVDAFDAEHAFFVHQRHDRIVDVVPVGLDEVQASALRRELIGNRVADHPTWHASVTRREPVLVAGDECAELPGPPPGESQAGACASLPLVSDTGSLGVVHVATGHRRWRGQQVALAEQLSLEARMVVDNAVLREQEQQRLAELAHHATHDALTGLPNRALLQDRLNQALELGRRESTEVALLFVDLDRFKRINDRVGHAVADELLREVSRRLSGCVRGQDTVGRLAGDEFVVVIHATEGVRDAEQVASRIACALSTPVVVADDEIFVSASIGISCARPDEADGDWLLRAADAAMFRVKRGGRGRHATYDAALDVLAETTLGLESDLHHALERDELTLRYQPIVALDDGHAGGFEALLRWEHPERGTIPPLDFIPLAEATGLIVPIGGWVVEQACRQLGEWRRQHPEQDLFVSVNLSATQVHDPGLVALVERALEAAGVPPGSLMLEITESSLMHEEEGLPTLADLHRLGVRIAIDDFGTGYSALSYLQRFPIDVLKVDKSFVSRLGKGPGEGALARTVVAIARTLGVPAIAEGIEHLDQLDELRSLGSQMGQGFHFAAPLESDAAESWLLTTT